MKSPKNQNELKILNELEKYKKSNLLKTSINNKGYCIYKISINDEIIKYIKEYLIAKPFSIGSLVEPKKFPIYMESNTKLYIPRFWGIKMFGYPKEINISFGLDKNFKFNGELRDYQLNVINKYLKSINYGIKDIDNKGDSGGLICLGTGQGKTVIALKIIEYIKKKTIIFVQKEFLKNQWIERINQFLPNVNIGTIQGQIIDYENKDIVIAMVQSISMKEYPKSIFDEFGFSIYDECFPKDTTILTNNGKIQINEIYMIWNKFNLNNNIQIISYNIETNQFEYNNLTYAWKKYSFILLEFTFENNSKFKCTYNHKIYTPDGYIKAYKLKKNKYVCFKNDNNQIINYKIIKIIQVINDAGDVYDIEVANNHNYIINDGMIVSNCHHMSSEIFSNCMRKCNTLYTLGLTATIDRKDGLTYILKMYLGDICFRSNAMSQDYSVIVKAIEFSIPDDDDYNFIDRDYKGNAMLSKIISRISKNNFRNDFIISVIKNELIINNNQQIILLAHNKTLLTYLYNNIDFTSKGYYIGGMKPKDLKESENKQLILATYAMAAEALDIKTLSTLLLASSKSDIIQSVGRILRQKHDKHLIIDIIDTHEPFKRQFEKRKLLYNERSYKILKTNYLKYYDYIKAVSLNQEFDYMIYWDEYIKQNKKKNNCLLTL